MTERDKVVAVARTWLGTPYHHAARVKGAGTDCGMSLIAIFAESGMIEDFTPDSYPQDWMNHRSQERYLSTVETYAAKVNRPALPGDIALFRFGRCISHGAIVTEWPRIIHAYKPAGCVVEDDAEANEDLKNRFVGIWSIWR
jgi:NlpC/P60 family putative phage cell wall peptidase